MCLEWIATLQRVNQILSVLIIHTAEAEESMLTCWMVGRGRWVDKLLKEEAE